jgi:RNA polymerase sigma-70 factor (ECF subfamily)
MSQEEPLLPDDEDDKRLMGLVAAGDDDALRLLVHRHHARLVGYLRGEVGSQATAEELAMEVFIRLHRAASRWRPEAKLSTYLIHIARNLVLNEWRRRGRKPTTALEFAAEPGDQSQGSVRRVAELDEAFQRAILQLPPEQRTAILLVVQQELPGLFREDLDPPRPRPPARTSQRFLRPRMNPATSRRARCYMGVTSHG